MPGINHRAFLERPGRIHQPDVPAAASAFQYALSGVQNPALRYVRRPDSDIADRTCSAMLFAVVISGFEQTLDIVCVCSLHVDLDLLFLVQAYVACPITG